MIALFVILALTGTFRSAEPWAVAVIAVMCIAYDAKQAVEKWAPKP